MKGIKKKNMLLNSKMVLSLIGAIALITTTAVIVFSDNDSVTKSETLNSIMENYIKALDLTFEDQDTVLVSTIKSAGFNLEVGSGCLDDSYVRISIDENGKSSYELVEVCKTNEVDIKLKGDANVTLEVGKNWVELGATATVDDQDVSNAIEITNNIDNTKLGTYTVVYSITRNGVESKVSRNVEVVDTTKPEIYLRGSSVMSTVITTRFTDPGFRAVDNYDGDITSSVKVSGTVNTSSLGTNVLTYTVTDASGNSTTITRTVNVVDAKSPIISLRGTATVNLNYLEEYNEAGFTASDPQDGDISSRVQIIGNVNNAVLGKTVLTYRVTNSFGKTAEVQRIINVRDITSPTINLIGWGSEVSFEYGTQLPDGLFTAGVGFTANDNYDGNITAKVIVSPKTINTSNTGLYFINYTVTDTNANTVTIQRMVRIIDTTKPEITLNGDSIINHTVGTPFNDEGATVIDEYDGLITDNLQGIGTVNSNVVGTYTLSYNSSDLSGNTAIEVTRTINVIDDVKPEITIDPEVSYIFQDGEIDFMDGIKVTDNYDQSIECVNEECLDIVIIDGTIPTDENGFIIGTYTITYTVEDEAGNLGFATRTVYILDKEVPVIIIDNDGLSFNEETGRWVFTTSVCTEEICEDIIIPAAVVEAPETCGELEIIATSDVEINKIGKNYTITYTVAPSEFCKAAEPVVVNVEVIDSEAPEISMNKKVILINEGETLTIHKIFKGIELSDNYDGVICIAAECDGIIQYIISGGFDEESPVPGTYTITYNATDLSGNIAEVTRTIIVRDRTAPELQINLEVVDKDLVVIRSNEEFDYMNGVTAYDAVDGDRTANIEVTGLPTDYPLGTKVGTFTLTYTVADRSGNYIPVEEEITRIIQVVPTAADAEVAVTVAFDTFYDALNPNDYRNPSDIISIRNAFLKFVQDELENYAPETALAILNNINDAVEVFKEYLEDTKTLVQELTITKTEALDMIDTFFNSLTSEDYSQESWNRLESIYNDGRNAITVITEEDITAVIIDSIKPLAQNTVDGMDAITKLCGVRINAIRSIKDAYDAIEDKDNLNTTDKAILYNIKRSAIITIRDINSAAADSVITSIATNAIADMNDFIVEALEIVSVINNKLGEFKNKFDLEFIEENYSADNWSIIEQIYIDAENILKNLSTEDVSRDNVNDEAAAIVENAFNEMEKIATLAQEAQALIDAMDAKENELDEAVSEYQEVIYTPSSWAAFKDAIADIKEEIRKLTTIEDVENFEFTEAIDEAAGELVTLVAQALIDAKAELMLDLEEAITALNLNPEEFTSESWEAYQTALTSIRSQINSLDNLILVEAFDVNEAIDEAAGELVTLVAQALIDAKAELMLDLEEAITALNLNPEEFTSESWEAYQTALTSIRSQINGLDNLILVEDFNVIESLETAKSILILNVGEIIADIPETVNSEEAVNLTYIAGADVLEENGTNKNIRFVIEVVQGPTGLQLLAFDGNEWWDIIQFGWGPSTGFQVNPGVIATTPVTVKATESGLAEVEIKVVSVDATGNIIEVLTSSEPIIVNIEVGEAEDNTLEETPEDNIITDEEDENITDNNEEDNNSADLCGVLDCSELNPLIAQILLLDEEDYNNWSLVAEALLIEVETQEDIDNKVIALQDALDQLLEAESEELN